jgi:hypothetical protein
MFLWAAAPAARESSKKLLLMCAAAALMSTGALAESTVVTTTTGAGHAAVQIEPEYRTKIRTYVTEHKIRPVETREKIVVGAPVPREVSSRRCRLNGGHRLPGTATSIPASA